MCVRDRRNERSQTNLKKEGRGLEFFYFMLLWNSNIIQKFPKVFIWNFALIMFSKTYKYNTDKTVFQTDTKYL